MVLTLEVVSLVAVASGGWTLGRKPPIVNLPVLVLTLFAAITAHSAMQWAFLEGRMDGVTGDPRGEASPLVIVAIAAVEAVGLWVPFLVLPWARVLARVGSAVYALAASVLAGVYHYFPFDLLFISRDLIDPTGPPYLFAWFVCLPFAGAGYLAGSLQASRERADRDLDWKDLPG